MLAPTDGLLADYVGSQAAKGKTAPRGVSAGLKRMAHSLRLGFPLSADRIAGWEMRLNTHRVTQQIPIEVAQCPHFEYLMEKSTHAPVLATCATVFV